MAHLPTDAKFGSRLEQPFVAVVGAIGNVGSTANASLGRVGCPPVSFGFHALAIDIDCQEFDQHFGRRGCAPLVCRHALTGMWAGGVSRRHTAAAELEGATGTGITAHAQ